MSIKTFLDNLNKKINISYVARNVNQFEMHILLSRFDINVHNHLPSPIYVHTG